jgi:hypothetical protein
LAVLAVCCLLASRGLCFVVDLPHAILPCFGVFLLIAAAVIGKVCARPRLAAGAVAFLQMTLFTMLGVVLAYALAARDAPLWDVRLAAADRRLGLDWPAILRVADTAPAALRLGKIAYDSLIAQMVLCIVVLSATGRTAALRTAVVAAILSGTVIVAISGVVPAMGNLFDAARYHHLSPSIAWQERGLISGLRDGSARVLDPGRLMGIVSFPSYHAALPVILARAVRDVRLLRIAAPAWAAITILATPIFGGHYGVDVLAGIGLACMAIAVSPLLVTWSVSLRFVDQASRAVPQSVVSVDHAGGSTTPQPCRLVDEGIG